MVKAWCIWCENGNQLGNNDYFWIHEECAHKLMGIHSSIRCIKEMLKGEHPRNKEEETKIETIYKFIEDMETCERRWKGTMKIIRDITKK